MPRRMIQEPVATAPATDKIWHFLHLYTYLPVINKHHYCQTGAAKYIQTVKTFLRRHYHFIVLTFKVIPLHHFKRRKNMSDKTTWSRCAGFRSSYVSAKRIHRSSRQPAAQEDREKPTISGCSYWFGHLYASQATRQWWNLRLRVYNCSSRWVGQNC